jgi:hypothetical protein
MANVQNSNSFYVDSTGLLSDKPNIRVSGIIFTPNAANDAITLIDGTGGSTKLKIQGATAKNTVLIDFHMAPIVFPNGIFVSAITASAVATIITTGTDQVGR